MGERWTPAYARMFDPDHHLADEPACRRWAWLDLCHMAQYEDGVRLIRGKPIRLKRGELVASLRFLAERWTWSVKKVRIFLDTLEDPTLQKLKTVRGTPEGTVYSVVAYDTYANPGHREGHTQGTPPPESSNSSDANDLGAQTPEQDPKTRGTGEGIGRGTPYRKEPQRVTPQQGHSQGHTKGHSQGTARAQRTSVTQQVTEASPQARTRGVSNVENSDADLDAIPGGAELAVWLGEHENGVVARFVAADDANGGAVRSILATYTSGSMTGERTWGDTPAEERKIVLADALETLAGEGSRYKANFFRRIVQDRLAEGIGGGSRTRRRTQRRDDVRPFSPKEMETYMDLRQELVAEGMDLNAAAEEANRRVIEGEVTA